MSLKSRSTGALGTDSVQITCTVYPLGWKEYAVPNNIVFSYIFDPLIAVITTISLHFQSVLLCESVWSEGVVCVCTYAHFVARRGPAILDLAEAAQFV